MHYTTLYSMADISKQIDKGQEKQNKGVDLKSITNVNNYIKFKVIKYRYYNFTNDDMWE
jgi:hypothetical protein